MHIDKKAHKEEFLTLLRSTEREGVEDLLEELERLGFFEAPASAGHHLNEAGGLVLHSLNTCKAALAVWESMQKLEPWLAKEIERESVIIASLLHDVCKSDIYKPTIRRQKNELGVWEDRPAWDVSYKSFPFGHGEKSVVMVLYGGITLTDAEMCAIRWHMGAWGLNFNSYEDQRSYDTAQEVYPLVSIIHAADSLAAHLMERTEESL